MWSGPRNISTAMMRSWGNRPDSIVCDEPLYAHYLTVTGLPHPGAEETIVRHEADWQKVVAWLTGELPDGKAVFYQKHMAHHLLPNIELDWLDSLTNCFLIREPREMLTSLLEFIPEPRVEDTGLPQQVRILELVRERTNSMPPVLDSKDVLENPRGVLTALCNAVGVKFYDEMLQWRPGFRDTDGVWAKHWYAKVEHTTSFVPYRSKPDPVPATLTGVLEECNELYQQLYRYRITAT
ncbi:MAG: sulfotransferase family protein [Planctomycetaceae bacterium]|nr:sulfotransferase family protein [Planctomycetaceae bacterium]